MLKSYVNDLERYNDFQLKKAVKILVWIFTNFPNSGIWFQLWLCWKVTLMISNVVWWMANVVLRHQSSWDWSRWRKNDVKTGPWNHLPQDPWGFQQVRLHHHGDPQQPPIDVTSLVNCIVTEKKNNNHNYSVKLTYFISWVFFLNFLALCVWRVVAKKSKLQKITWNHNIQNSFFQIKKNIVRIKFREIINIKKTEKKYGISVLWRYCLVIAKKRI